MTAGTYGNFNDALFVALKKKKMGAVSVRIQDKNGTIACSSLSTEAQNLKASFLSGIGLTIESYRQVLAHLNPPLSPRLWFDLPEQSLGRQPAPLAQNVR